MMQVRFAAPRARASRSVQRVCIAMCCAGTFGVATALAPAVRADVVAYLVNVTVRPGYDFPNASAAVSYGYGVCDKVSGGEGLRAAYR